MKPSSFDYLRVRSVDEALVALHDSREDTKVIAGGQSLVPLLNFRLAEPSLLIDINDLHDLSYIRRVGEGLHIGALTRHATLEKSPVVSDGWPLLQEAVRFVAHAQIRSRGTIGGSVAHADPAAELPVALAALDAEFITRSVSGSRRIPWCDFFLGPMTTALTPDELLVEIRVPSLQRGHGFAFVEHTRRNGDFALAGAGVLLDLDSDRRCSRIAVALLGAAPTPLRATDAEDRLLGALITEETAGHAARIAAEAAAPSGDLHGSATYHRSLLEVVVRRAILAANLRVQEP